MIKSLGSIGNLFVCEIQSSQSSSQLVRAIPEEWWWDSWYTLWHTIRYNDATWQQIFSHSDDQFRLLRVLSPGSTLSSRLRRCNFHVNHNFATTYSITSTTRNDSQGLGVAISVPLVRLLIARLAYQQQHRTPAVPNVALWARNHQIVTNFQALTLRTKIILILIYTQIYTRSRKNKNCCNI